MTADYDSEADALSIDFIRFDRYDRQIQIDDGDCCSVGFVAGKVVDLELFYPARHLDLLDLAAERYDLDGEALVAIARAALAAPDRLINMDVSESRVA